MEIIKLINLCVWQIGVDHNEVGETRKKNLAKLTVVLSFNYCFFFFPGQQQILSLTTFSFSMGMISIFIMFFAPKIPGHAQTTF